MRRFLRGVKAYQNHPDHRDVTEAPVIWREGTTCLRDYAPNAPASAPLVLVIPSLINRFTILDLDFVPSFLRAMAAQGFRPLVVDWDAPGTQEKNFDLSDYVTKRLFPILDFARTLNLAPLHVTGYCMGGLLALALASLRPARVKTLNLMAVPWDFHAQGKEIGPAFRKLSRDLEPLLKETGQLPVDVIQSLFAAFQPLHVPAKFSAFAKLDPFSMEARQFVLVEDWLNGGVPLTAKVARECLGDWYGENYTAKGEWHIDGALIDPKEIKAPAYLIVPGRDRIVHPASAIPLARLLPHATLHEPMMGHIGMIASRHAPHQVWAPLFHWLKQHA